MSNAQNIIKLVRELKPLFGDLRFGDPSVDFDVVVHNVRRQGDAALGLVTITYTRNGVRFWKASRLAVLFDRCANGIRPRLVGRTKRSRAILRALSMVIGAAHFTGLAYRADSFAHFWCADNAPHLYS